MCLLKNDMQYNIYYLYYVHLNFLLKIEFLTQFKTVYCYSQGSKKTPA